MPARALASALKDFGLRPAAAVSPFLARPDLSIHDADLPAFADMPLAEPESDAEATVRDAVALAETALAERLETEHATALQAERDRHADELAELQARFANEAGERIQASLEDMEHRVVELTGAVTARILGIVLTDDMRGRSIEKLGGIIRDALGDDEAVRIRVSGSPTLYEALRQKLPQYADQLDYTESPTFDLSVTIDDSVFETRLAEWSTALSEALS